MLRGGAEFKCSLQWVEQEALSNTCNTPVLSNKQKKNTVRNKIINEAAININC